MNMVDRFTRDRVSRFLWGVLTVVFGLLTVYALRGERGSLSDLEREAQTRAAGYTRTTLFQNLDSKLVSGPILGQNYRNLLIPVQAEIMTNGEVARLRIWGVDGSLLFSTDQREKIGSQSQQDPSINTALGGETTSVLAADEVVAKQGLAGSSQRLFQTYVPLLVPDRSSVVGAAQIDQLYAPMVDASKGPWRSLQIALGIGLLLCLVMTALSFRRSQAVVGAGVNIDPPPQPATIEDVSGESVQLRAELEQARAQLQQAEEARRLAEAVAQGPGSGSGEVSGEIAELHARVASAELARDEAYARLVVGSTTSAEPTGASDDRVHELQDQLMQEQMRRANAERAARDAEVAAQASANQRVQQLEMELRTMRDQLAGARAGDAPDVEAIRAQVDVLRRELDGVRAEVDAAKFEAQTARVETDLAKQQLMREREQAEAIEPVTEASAEPVVPEEPSPPSPVGTAGAHEDDGAGEAASPSPEDPAAKDLRARLTKSAARKRAGSHPEGES